MENIPLAIFPYLAVAALILVLIARGRHSRIESQLTALGRIDAKLDLLLKQAGIKYEPFAGLSSGVIAALRAGNKIQAIKLYRQDKSVGLKEAKDFIEAAMSKADGKV